MKQPPKTIPQLEMELRAKEILQREKCAKMEHKVDGERLYHVEWVDPETVRLTPLEGE